jgi:hypothetical protein
MSSLPWAGRGNERLFIFNQLICASVANHYDSDRLGSLCPTVFYFAGISL